MRVSLMQRAKACCTRVGKTIRTHMRKLVKARMRGESFRKFVGRNIDNSLLASSIDIFQVFLGLLVTIIYFNQNWEQFSPNLESVELAHLQLVIGAFFTLDYAMRFYAADSRYNFFCSPTALVDLVTILPQWLEVIFESNSDFKTRTSALKTLRALRFLRAYRLLIFSKTAKGRQAGVLFLTVMSIIICSAGVIQAVEACGPNDVEGKNCQTMEIYNACYFVVITIATLGYGDIAPKSGNGKVGVIFLIFSTGILLPLQISRYSDILNRETEYDKAFTDKKEKNPHILICGEVNSSPLDFFLRQFLHPNNMNWKDKVVILCPSLPSHNLKRILLNSAYEQRVMYLQGSAMLDSDLKRAGAANARLCFVLLNKLTVDGDRSDTASNLLTISLRHHTKRVPLFVQVMKTDNVRHVHLSGASNIVCIDQLKMGLLAKTCIVPGLCALLCNILFTFRPFYKRSTLWTAEFLHGCAHDIYEARLPSYLDFQITFTALATIVYTEFHVVLIGMTDNLDELRLFPPRLRLRKSHTLLVLSKTPDCTRWIESLPLATLQKYQSLIPDYAAVVEAWSDNTFSGRLKTTRDNIMRRSVSLTRGATIRSLVTANSKKDARKVEKAVSRVLPTDPNKGDDDDDSDEFDDDADAQVICTNEEAQTPPPADILRDQVVKEDEKPQESLPAADATTTTETSNDDSLPTKSSNAHIVLAPLQVHDKYRLLQQKKSSKSNIMIANTSSHSSSESVQSAAANSAHQCGVSIADLSNTMAMKYNTFINGKVPPDLSNHIILCGMPNMLHDFVAPLRPRMHRNSRSTTSVTEVPVSSDDTMTIAPIVIISLLPVTEKQYASIAMYDHVYYVHGSPLHETILREASVFTSKSIVIISTCTQSNSNDENELTNDFIDQNMIDTDAITLHRFITEACESNCPMDATLPTVIIELSRPSSLRFLKDEHTKTEDVELMKEVRAMTRQVLSRADDPLDNVCHPLYAAGKVCVSNFLDALLGSCNSYGTIIDLFHVMILGEPVYDSTAKTRTLTQIPIPHELWGHTYGQVFHEMLTNQDTLALGLYRSRGNGIFFVFVNPPEDILVTPQDKLFIIH